MKNGKEVRPNGITITKAPNGMYYVEGRSYPHCWLKDARKAADGVKAK